MIQQVTNRYYTVTVGKKQGAVEYEENIGWLAYSANNKFTKYYNQKDAAIRGLYEFLGVKNG